MHIFRDSGVETVGLEQLVLLDAGEEALSPMDALLVRYIVDQAVNTCNLVTKYPANVVGVVVGETPTSQHHVFYRQPAIDGKQPGAIIDLLVPLHDANRALNAHMAYRSSEATKDWQPPLQTLPLFSEAALDPSASPTEL